jgi:hypothetical protein
LGRKFGYYRNRKKKKPDKKGVVRDVDVDVDVFFFLIKGVREGKLMENFGFILAVF